MDTDDTMITEFYLWVVFRCVYLLGAILIGYIYRLFKKCSSSQKSTCLVSKLVFKSDKKL